MICLKEIKDIVKENIYSEENEYKKRETNIKKSSITNEQSSH